MKIIEKFKLSIEESFSLDRFHRRLSIFLSALAFLTGIVVFTTASYGLLSFLDVKTDYCVNCDENSSYILLILMVMMPFMFYIGIVIFNGLFGLIMFSLNKFTLEEAAEFALFYRYPRHWLG